MLSRFVFGLVVALATTAVTAEAAVVICSNKKGKLTLRVDACKAKETAVNAADLGVTGPKGDAGDAGPAGVSGLEVVTADAAITSLSLVTPTVVASCPAGKRVLGGGGEFVPQIGTIELWEVTSSKPITTDPQGWSYTVRADVTEDVGIRAYAICATVTP